MNTLSENEDSYAQATKKGRPRKPLGFNQGMNGPTD